MNGKQQRNALTAAERSISALGKGDPAGARRAIARAVELDQLGIYGEVSKAIALAASDLEAGAAITDEHWDGISYSLGPGPLAAVVKDLRSA